MRINPNIMWHHNTVRLQYKDVTVSNESGYVIQFGRHFTEKTINKKQQQYYKIRKRKI